MELPQTSEPQEILHIVTSEYWHHAEPEKQVQNHA